MVLEYFTLSDTYFIHIFLTLLTKKHKKTRKVCAKCGKIYTNMGVHTLIVQDGSVNIPVGGLV